MRLATPCGTRPRSQASPGPPPERAQQEVSYPAEAERLSLRRRRDEDRSSIGELRPLALGANAVARRLRLESAAWAECSFARQVRTRTPWRFLLPSRRRILANR